MAKTKPVPMGWNLEHSIVHLLHRASQTAEDLFTRSVAFANITPRQFAVLAAVARDPNLSQTELVRLTGVDRSTMADIVRRLVRNGLLSRNRTREDARAYSIRLTPRAFELVAQMSASAVEAEKALLAPLDTANREKLVELLRELVEASRERIEAGSTAESHELERRVVR